MLKSRKKARKRYKDNNCNLFNAKPYSGRNTKRSFNRLKYIIELHEFLENDYIKRIDILQKHKTQLLELCRIASERINLQKKQLEKEEQITVYLKDIVLEFGDNFDWNDLMFQNTHLRMYLNTNHRIN